MQHLYDMIGVEQPLTAVSRALKQYAGSFRAPLVGAVHVTCSDESERECVDAFQDTFVQEMLPELKFHNHSPFRSANLGGRYEWGAVRIAEQHFATRDTVDAFKVLVVKINAHVCVDDSSGPVRYGQMGRYGQDSPYCGAIDALLRGDVQPFARQLREAFLSEGLDRLQALGEADENVRRLLAALVGARLQARRAILDIQDYAPTTPTVYLVAPAVTINRPQRDTEVLCGVYVADRRGETGEVTYRGLGDDPAAYRLEQRHRSVRVSEEGMQQPRAARDHRQLVFDAWKDRHVSLPTDDPRLEEILQATAKNEHQNSAAAKAMLGSLLWILADVSPVPVSILLFAKGIAGIHNAYRAHRLARGEAQAADARVILEEMQQRLDTLSPEQVRRVIEMLIAT